MAGNLSHADFLLGYLDASDAQIQVLTYEWSALQRARAMTDTLNAMSFPSSGGMPRDVLKECFGRGADFEVVSDGMLVLDVNNRSQPFITLAPDAPITRDILAIAADLTRPVGTQRTAAGAH